MRRVFNFSPGPSMLSEAVLKKAAGEMLDCEGSGQSVMEMSHRSPDFEKIINGAESLLRDLMNIPTNYRVLFLQGGAYTQFAMVPLNLLPEGGEADYIETGVWAEKAALEAEKYGKVNVAASSKDKKYSYIPAPLPAPSIRAAYYHITTNNTIVGTRYTSLPETKGVPLVADMSSNIMSEPVDVTRFGLIYAGAQKNLGPAGTTIVIVREDLLGRHRPFTPTMLRYDIQAENKSLYNTPPCYGIYIIKLVLEDIKSRGGLSAIYEINKEKAKILYDFLDSSRLFAATAAKKDRSLMNIPFALPSEELNKAFLKEAGAA
ncbi:MAG: 3-phosphoserine/phosphohydroxythreonine transaminase, partial [Spirochaetales bacterium]|nr:3-phosphoserine/phosphohydroxythreonine transaminase [Spirochaetales bacterium]